MFVTQNQLYVFIACVAFGGGCGVLLSIANLLHFLTKNRIVNIVFSVIALSLIGVLFSYYSYKMFFPNVRLYMLVGVMIGIYLYYKSFYILLAKFLKKFYNIYEQKIRKLKGKRNDRIKSKKNDSGDHSRRNIVTGNIVVGNGLSNDFNKGRRKSHRPFKRAN